MRATRPGLVVFCPILVVCCRRSCAWATLASAPMLRVRGRATGAIVRSGPWVGLLFFRVRGRDLDDRTAGVALVSPGPLSRAPSFIRLPNRRGERRRGPRRGRWAPAAGRETIAIGCSGVLEIRSRFGRGGVAGAWRGIGLRRAARLEHAVARRADAEGGFEHPREMRLVGEAGGEGHVGQRPVPS